MECSSDPRYDINTTQNICTRRSIKLYELREKKSKYTPKLVQLLEGSDDFPLPMIIYKLNTNLVTIMLYMVLGHLP